MEIYKDGMTEEDDKEFNRQWDVVPPRKVYDARNEETTDVWLSPPWLIKALGEFDLDPSAPKRRPWDMAKHHYTIEDDGLSKEWRGRVWLNPPYGSATRKWIKRLREHGNGIAFIYTRTETEMFFDDVWSAADAVFFFKGRVACHRPDGTKNSSPASASCLIAYGAENVRAIQDARLDGQLVIRAWAMVPNVELRGPEAALSPKAPSRTQG